jgi:polynucleotide 5'-hydroxyl-kinase GRC3/NOL9
MGGDLVVPVPWQRLPLSGLQGVVLVVGATNTGKSTFARYLYGHLQERGRRVAYLDGDPGQSVLGPPATITLGLGAPGETTFPPAQRQWQWFIGAVSPRGHMLPLLAGASRLVTAARAAGAGLILYDTSGLVAPAYGGTALKQALVDLLQPAAIFAIQEAQELETSLLPWRRSPALRLFELLPAPAVRARDTTARQAYRAQQFARYFCDGRPLTLDWSRVAIFPRPTFRRHQLVALRGHDGFTLGLGIVVAHEPARRQLTVLTPLSSLETASALHLGDCEVSPETFRDRPLER